MSKLEKKLSPVLGPKGDAAAFFIRILSPLPMVLAMYIVSVLPEAEGSIEDTPHWIILALSAVSTLATAAITICSDLLAKKIYGEK